LIIYPAIDLLDGNCVRLLKGKYDDVTVYANEPYKMAEKWCSEGASYIHVVDLNGAKEGKTVNGNVIKRIAETSSVPVQLGGGIRTIEDVRNAFSLGVERVILGTVAVSNPDFVKIAVDEFGDRIVVGIDAKNGFAATEGWEQTSKMKAVDLALQMKGIGIKTIIYTDIDTDGTLKGPNLSAMEEMASKTGLSIIASGGVGNINHIKELKRTGVSGVIVGRAIYTGDLNLKEAILEGMN